MHLQRYKVWVLAPLVESDDPNIQYYYDFTQSIAEYTRVFEHLETEWQWQPVTMQNFKTVIAGIAGQNGKLTPLVLNLCDGDEVNGAPGISVIEELQKHGLLYTGSDTYFYDITTSKIPMKQAFDAAGVANAAWEVIDPEGANIPGIFERLGSPLIIKPAISGGSMGLAIKNVVTDEAAMRQRVKELYDGYRGWHLTTGGLIAEQFVKGREFTTFITGSNAGNMIVYEPVERVFHESLPEHEQFLSFDRLWETYDEETPMPDNAYVYVYSTVSGPLAEDLKKLSVEAYQSVKGKGYGRLDIRMDAATGKLYMLEVNAQCGLSEDEDYTSIGAILKASNKTFTRLVTEVLLDAVQRATVKKPVRKAKTAAG